ncbi:type II toxin-antitoxin system VapC family toxin [Planktothrix serta]|uniref:type II toxin-antitoxin system VapC family toxin n=1 Tax=Planktothrix serta TaxID=1678310 RepID=UPI001E4D4A34|nr:hypothetical protein [Planktothrix serta]
MDTSYLQALANPGDDLHQRAIEVTERLGVFVPVTSELFKSAVKFYSQRLDKGYSLTDCASMLIMRQKGIQDILTYDKHFLQEGFNALLRE